jgi:ATP-binding cassette subfamily F protein 3
MAVLIASGLRKEINGTPLFDGVSLTVNRRDRVALAGQNGAGKTTLLRAIAGQVELQSGELVFSKGAKVALHDQRPPLEQGLSLDDYVLGGAKELVAVEARLRELEQAMAGGAHDAATMRRYSEAQARLEHAGGYMWRERITSVLRGLGFADEQLERPLSSFSGGEITRASLARALAGDPDLLLLDEPTNHLDVTSLEWLERELQTLDAAIVLVAHDRWFLEAVGTAVLELERGKGTFFAGPWHAYRQEMAARASLQAKVSERQDEEIARLEHFVARFRYGTKARQAQSRLKMIDKLEGKRVEAPKAKARGLGFEFLKPPRSGRTVVEARELAVRVPGRELLHDSAFAIERGEHVALVGPNGSGKTTLLEVLLGRRDADAGELRWGANLNIGYYDQRLGIEEFDPENTVMEEVMADRQASLQDLRDILALMLFRGDDANKKIGMLSGGERARVRLAQLLLDKPNVLVLDEPTNHLDIASREALEGAMSSFEGTMICVSHDRYFLDKVVKRMFVVTPPDLEQFEGNYSEWHAKEELAAAEAAERAEANDKRARAMNAAKPQASKSSAGKKDNPYLRPFGRLSTADLELQITETEIAIAECQEAFGTPEAFRDAGNVKKLQAEQEALVIKLEQLEAEYFEREE